jgi:hypothetical protein
MFLWHCRLPRSMMIQKALTT